MSSESPLVLVADDDPDVLALLGFRLRRAGFRVLVVPDGQSALDAIAERRPDVAVLDIGLPSLDGLEVCRIARSGSLVRELGIVFLTARTEARDVARGIGAGADAYVKKPFAWPELLERIERVLERTLEPPAPARPTAA